MCGRFGQTASGDHLSELFRGIQIADPEPRYNVAPTQKVLAVGGSAQRGWHAGYVRWGLMPYFAPTREEAQKRSLINARAETALQKPVFARAARSGRVVVPATFFYEWLSIPGQPRQPMAFRRRDHDLLLLAALVDTWRAADGSDSVSSLTILTTAPNLEVAPVHNRMPAIIETDQLDDWLDPSSSPPDAWRLLQPLRAGILISARASTLVNSVRNEGPELLIA